MADCNGDLPMTAKVDQSMKEFLDSEADRCGVTRSELIRRVFDDFRDSHRENLNCPSCGQPMVIDPCPQ